MQVNDTDTYVAAEAGVGGAHHVLGLEHLLRQLRPVGCGGVEEDVSKEGRVRACV